MVSGPLTYWYVFPLLALWFEVCFLRSWTKLWCRQAFSLAGLIVKRDIPTARLWYGFDSFWYGSVRYGTVRFGSVRFG